MNIKYSLKIRTRSLREATEKERELRSHLEAKEESVAEARRAVEALEREAEENMLKLNESEELLSEARARNAVLEEQLGKIKVESAEKLQQRAAETDSHLEAGI